MKVLIFGKIGFLAIFGQKRTFLTFSRKHLFQIFSFIFEILKTAYLIK
jgi:hypothetical protein